MSKTVRADVFLACAIAAEVTATLSLKGMIYNSWLVIVVIAGYGASFYFLAITLRNGKSIGVAYGIWGACGVVLTASISWLVFNEPLSSLKVAGFVLIALGVVIVEVGAGLHQRKRDREAVGGGMGKVRA